MAIRGPRERSLHIQEFIINQVSIHPVDITRRVADQFGISRQAAHRHVNRLVVQGILLSHGETRDRRYELKPIVNELFSVEITSTLEEDVIWRERLRPLLGHVSPNVLSICEYGFTEMLNNAIDHSAGTQVIISLQYTLAEIKITINDNGVGIFRKIQSELNLEDPRHAILELAKGKLTTDPSHHTGEGIFFTSRAFDKFSILSDTLFFTHMEADNDWLLEGEEATKGTVVFMHIHQKSVRKLQEVFDKYTSEQDDYGFTRTYVPVALTRYGDENLISRSQAKRLLARFDRFREVILDFKGVDIIGQAFADEIFRVFSAQNSHVHIWYINANEQVTGMIRHAGGYEEQEVR